MPASRAFAERSVDLLMLSGKRIPFRVEFGPIRAARQGFHCRVRFHGWGDSPPDIQGQDSLGAFIHALTVVHGVLAALVQKGGKVLCPGTDMDYDLENFVSSPEWSRAEPSACTGRGDDAQYESRTSPRGASEVGR